MARSKHGEGCAVGIYVTHIPDGGDTWLSVGEDYADAKVGGVVVKYNKEVTRGILVRCLRCLADAVDREEFYVDVSQYRGDIVGSIGHPMLDAAPHSPEQRSRVSGRSRNGQN